MKTFIFLALILCSAAVSPAQTFRGGIQGTVTDPNGAVIPGADVTITNPGRFDDCSPSIRFDIVARAFFRSPV